MEELAAKAGLVVGTVCKYEKGHRVPAPPFVLKLAKALGCSTDDFGVGGHPVRRPAEPAPAKKTAKKKVILAAEDWDAWLDSATPLKAAEKLIRPCPADLPTATRVSPAVGSVKNDGPQLLESYTPPAPPAVVDLFAAFA